MTTLAAVPIQGATYYVAKTGNDVSACTQAQPCLTITRAGRLAALPGDIVQVAAGTYQENLTLTSSGSASGGKITWRGQDGSGCPTTAVSDVNHPTGARPNPAVIIAGSVTVQSSYTAIDCFKITGGGIGVATQKTNVDITNNEIQGRPGGHGITFDGVDSVPSSQYASSATVSRNYIHATSNGFWIACSNCTFIDNEIVALQGDEPGSDHDYIDAWGNNTVIRHNYMHDNTSNACNSYDCHMDCIQTWNTVGNGTEVSKNITFDRNVCFNHHEGVIVQDNAGNGDVSNWTVTNNVFAYGPYDDGSGHPAVAGSAHPWCWIFEDGQLGSSNHFYNNTCVSGSVGFRNASNGTADYKNNIYYNPPGGTIVYFNGGGTTTSGANNLYYTLGKTWGSTFAGDIVNQNPLFVGLGSSQQQCLGCNYSLTSGSPATDRGVNVSLILAADLTGLARPQGGGYDIGAYELNAGTPLPPTSLQATGH